MELSTENVFILYGRGKISAVFRHSRCRVITFAGVIAVDEINVVAVVYVFEDRRFFFEYKRVPAYMRYF